MNMSNNNVSGAADELLLVPEVAIILRETPGTVREYLRRGLLVGSRVGSRGTWKVRRRDVDAFLVAHQNVRPVQSTRPRRAS